MNLVIALKSLVPAAQYVGDLGEGTKEAYESIEWADERPQPTWDEIVAAWPDAEQAWLDQKAKEQQDEELMANAPDILRDLISRIEALEAKVAVK